MKLRICFLWTALVLPPACFSQMPQEVPPTSDHKPSAVVARAEIPFKLYQGYLIVAQGSLGTLERLNFLVDTGANPSAVDRRITKKLRLTGEAGKLALFNQNAHIERVVLPSLQLGPIRAESLPGLVQDLLPIEKVLGVRIDAIVGFDVLGRSNLTIDYRFKRIVFGPIEPSPLAVPFDTGPPTLTVQLRVEDQPVRLLVDTGAVDLLLFECKLRGRLRELPAHGVKRSFNSAETQFEVDEVWLPGVRLGKSNFGLERAFLVNDNENCGHPFDGVMGISALGLTQIAFDFEHHIFSWKK